MQTCNLFHSVCSACWVLVAVALLHLHCFALATSDGGERSTSCSESPFVALVIQCRADPTALLQVC